MRKDIAKEYERTITMLDINSEIILKAYRINTDMTQYKEMMRDAFNENAFKGIKLFQKNILSSWQECEHPALKRRVFDEYKKSLGTNVEDDVESNRDIVKKVLKRKIILDADEYRALHDHISDNFDEVKKHINKLNKLIQEFEKTNILE